MTATTSPWTKPSSLQLDVVANMEVDKLGDRSVISVVTKDTQGPHAQPERLTVGRVERKVIFPRSAKQARKEGTPLQL